MTFKSFYIQSTQGEVNDSDGGVRYRRDLDELLGISTTSMDFDVSSVEGEVQLQDYIVDLKLLHASPTGTQRHRPSDVVEVVSGRVYPTWPEWLDSILDTTMIDLIWVKQTP